MLARFVFETSEKEFGRSWITITGLGWCVVFFVLLVIGAWLAATEIGSY